MSAFPQAQLKDFILVWWPTTTLKCCHIVKVRLLMVHSPITPCFDLWETPGRGRCPTPSAPGRTRQESNLCKHLCGDYKPGTDPPHYQSTEQWLFSSGRFSFRISDFYKIQFQNQTRSRLEPAISELLTLFLTCWTNMMQQWSSLSEVFNPSEQ